MPYTRELKELIKKVEATRPARVEKKMRGEEFTLLSLKERQDRLEKFHPDYKAGSRTEIRVGPSKGYAIQPEMVSLLEARSRINPDLIDLDKVDFETDLLILGGGGAGTSAALMAQERGVRVTNVDAYRTIAAKTAPINFEGADAMDIDEPMPLAPLLNKAATPAAAKPATTTTPRQLGPG